MENDWDDELNGCVRDSKIDIIGQNDIRNQDEATVAISMLQCFGSSAAGLLYFQPSTARSSRRPPDVLLCHPKTGVLIIETKGHSMDSIEGAKGGSLLIRDRGFNRPMNPIRQVEDCMFEIKNAVQRELRVEREMPLFGSMVAFPNISESDWVGRGLDKALPGIQLIFRETLENKTRLRKRIGAYVSEINSDAKKTELLSKTQLDTVRMVLGDSAVINERRPPRADIDERLLGAYLDEMAALDKYLSREQQELSRLEVDGHPRLIRGVAGSGKTVVLANMASRYVCRAQNRQKDLFNQDSDESVARIAVVCFNRSLVPFIKTKIKDAFYQQTHLTSLPDLVLVTHLNGLMYHLCKKEKAETGGVEYLPVPGTTRGGRAREYIRELDEFKMAQPKWHDSLLFDAVFVDEGQDLEPEEYLLLIRLCREQPTGEAPLVVFYDDAQNLYAKPRPVWKDLGLDVQRGDRARVMKECFRNTREVIELAFNVLLGSQASAEERVTTREYADLNFLKQANLVEEHGDHFRIRFAERSFRKPEIKEFPNRQLEKKWISEEIFRLICVEQVRPEDILILFHRSEEFRDIEDELKTMVGDKLKGFIKPFGASEDCDQLIFKPNHLTISTTYGAKGYDAQIVFLAGADLFTTNREGRASFYVGASRAKMLLYVTGLDTLNSLVKESLSIAEVL